MTTQPNYLGIPDALGAGGAYLDGTDPVNGLKALLRMLAARIGGVVANETALAAVPAKNRADKQLVLVLSGPALWYRDDSSSASPSAGSVVQSTDSTSGRWLILPESAGLASTLAGTSSGQGASQVGVQDAAGRLGGATNVEAALANLGARILGAVANASALQAVSATTRANGMVVVKLDDYTLWKFASGSSASSSAWVIVPSSGSGRWLRQEASLTDLAATTSGLGAALIGNPGTGNTVQADLTTLLAVALSAPQKVTATIAFGALSAGNSNGAAVSVNVGATLPANARILGTELKLATPFTGGGASSVSLDLGTTADPTAIVIGADVLSAAVDGYASTMPRGKAPNKHFVSAGAQLLARFTPDGSHQLANLTAGSITIDVLYGVLA